MPPTQTHDLIEQRIPTVRGVIQIRAAGDAGDDDDGRTGVPGDADMRLINALARTRMNPEDIYVFDAAPSNNQLDMYYTRMAPSTLRNFARDAKAGVPIMNSHRTGDWFSYNRDSLELPVGRSYLGVVEKDGDIQTFRSSAYMVRGIKISDVSNDDLIRAIDAGTIFDVSIGYMGGWYRCGICGKDMLRDERCDHYPGAPVDGDRDNRAWAWIEDAGLFEWSLVYSGATPGAMIEKARALAVAGRFSAVDLDEIEGRLGVRIRPGVRAPASRYSARNIAPAEPDPQERTEDMDGHELIAALLADEGVAPATRERLERLRALASVTVDDMAALLTPALRAQEPVEVAELEQLRARVVELEPQAADGRAYREQLIADTLAAGVRAYGSEFQRERWERLLHEPTRTLEDITAFKAQFDTAARERLGSGGRQTGAADPADPLGLNATQPQPASRGNLNVFSAP